MIECGHLRAQSAAECGPSAARVRAEVRGVRECGPYIYRGPALRTTHSLIAPRDIASDEVMG